MGREYNPRLEESWEMQSPTLSSSLKVINLSRPQNHQHLFLYSPQFSPQPLMSDAGTMSRHPPTATTPSIFPRGYSMDDDTVRRRRQGQVFFSDNDAESDPEPSPAPTTSSITFSKSGSIKRIPPPLILHDDITSRMERGAGGGNGEMKRGLGSSASLGAVGGNHPMRRHTHGESTSSTSSLSSSPVSHAFPVDPIPSTSNQLKPYVLSPPPIRRSFSSPSSPKNVVEFAPPSPPSSSLSLSSTRKSSLPPTASPIAYKRLISKPAHSSRASVEGTRTSFYRDEDGTNADLPHGLGQEDRERDERRPSTAPEKVKRVERSSSRDSRAAYEDPIGSPPSGIYAQQLHPHHHVHLLSRSESTPIVSPLIQSSPNFNPSDFAVTGAGSGVVKTLGKKASGHFKRVVGLGLPFGREEAMPTPSGLVGGDDFSSGDDFDIARSRRATLNSRTNSMLTDAERDRAREEWVPGSSPNSALDGSSPGGKLRKQSSTYFSRRRANTSANASPTPMLPASSSQLTISQAHYPPQVSPIQSSPMDIADSSTSSKSTSPFSRLANVLTRKKSSATLSTPQAQPQDLPSVPAPPVPPVPSTPMRSERPEKLSTKGGVFGMFGINLEVSFRDKGVPDPLREAFPNYGKDMDREYDSNISFRSEPGRDARKPPRRRAESSGYGGGRRSDVETYASGRRERERDRGGRGRERSATEARVAPAQTNFLALGPGKSWTVEKEDAGINKPIVRNEEIMRRMEEFPPYSPMMAPRVSSSSRHERDFRTALPAPPRPRNRPRPSTGGTTSSASTGRSTAMTSLYSASLYSDTDSYRKTKPIPPPLEPQPPLSPRSLVGSNVGRSLPGSAASSDPELPHSPMSNLQSPTYSAFSLIPKSPRSPASQMPFDYEPPRTARAKSRPSTADSATTPSGGIQAVRARRERKQKEDLFEDALWSLETKKVSLSDRRLR
ncbi:hypothetical protein BT69DRAFT_168974 [Atractiella rhizophila]|nr:hypothetical protein BT69DRAFT_168974 [Atractiella rhizophila]